MLSNGLGPHVALRAAAPCNGGLPHLDIILSGPGLPEFGILQSGLVAKQPHFELASDHTLPHMVRAILHPST